jgi:hypothetical protein
VFSLWVFLTPHNALHCNPGHSIPCVHPCIFVFSHSPYRPSNPAYFHRLSKDGFVPNLTVIRLPPHPICSGHPAHPFARARVSDSPPWCSLFQHRQRGQTKSELHQTHLDLFCVLHPFHEGYARPHVLTPTERVQSDFFQRGARNLRCEIHGHPDQGAFGLYCCNEHTFIAPRRPSCPTACAWMSRSSRATRRSARPSNR